MASEPPFHRGNYKLRYTADEEADIMRFAKSWLATKGAASFAGGGGLTYLLIQNGLLASRLKVVKIAAGGFLAFSLARVNAVKTMQQELREKFPDGYAAQLHYLRSNRDAFNDYVQYARQNQGVPGMGGVGNRFSRTPQQPITPDMPPPVNTDIPGSQPTPAGLDDRFRPKMDGLLQGRPEGQDEEQPKKDKKGSYAVWRNQGSPPPPAPGSDQSSLPPLPPPPPPPGSGGQYENKPDRLDPPPPPPPKKPVKRNKYGDIIEE